MEQQPSNHELNDSEISYLYRLLGGILTTDTRAEYTYIEVRGVEQDPDKSPPRSFERQLPLAEMTELLGLDTSVEKLTGAEIKFEQEHNIDNDTDEPVESSVWVELTSQLQLEDEVIGKNEWYVLCEPNPGSYLSHSYVGVEYTDDQGMRISFANESFDGQGDFDQALALLFEHMDLSQRSLNQSDQEKLLKIAKLLES